MSERKTLCLIDLSGIFWANWHATGDQQIGEAFRRTVDRVQRFAYGYDYTAVCCDAPPYKRKELSADYKAQRDTPDAAALEQFRRVKERLVADGHLLWSVTGYEADDVIATACWLAREDDLDVTIASADKDLLQLAADGIEVVSTKTGDRYNADDVKAKFGVPPSLIGDMLALIGDAADNVRGVRGIGPKNAAKLLNEFGSLDDVLIAATEGHKDIPPKQCEAIAASAAVLRVSRQLVELYTDVPIEWSELYEERKAQPLTESPTVDDLDEDIQDAEFADEPNAPENEALKPEPAADAKPAEPKPAPRKEQTAIVLHQPWEMQLEPTSTGSAWKLAHILYDSRLYTKFGSAEAILAIMLRGRSLGLDSTTSLDNFHLIEGKPAMSADLIRGLAMKSAFCEYFDLVETTSERATWVTKRKGSSREVSITWTMEDALAAGLVTRDKNGEYHGVSRSGKPSIWDKYRRNQLKQRAGVELARTVYPDVTANLYMPEELES